MNVLTPAEVKQLNPANNVIKDPARGYVAAAVFDCQGGATAPGVAITLDTADARTRGFTPSLVAATATDNSGSSFFRLSRAGNLLVTATPSAVGKVASKVTAIVRAGASTVVLMYPTPCAG